MTRTEGQERNCQLLFVNYNSRQHLHELNFYRSFSCSKYGQKLFGPDRNQCFSSHTHVSLQSIIIRKSLLAVCNIITILQFRKLSGKVVISITCDQTPVWPNSCLRFFASLVQSQNIPYSLSLPHQMLLCVIYERKCVFQL